MHPLIREDISQTIKSLKKELVLLEDKTILISGGAGFIGSYLVAVLLTLNKGWLKKPCTVIVIDNLITGSKKNTLVNTEDDPQFQLIQNDICDPLPDINADYIIHAAGLASPHHYQKLPLETIKVAVDGTKNLLEFAKRKKVKGFLYFSSSEIYGDPDTGHIPTPETYWGNVSANGPRACYDESKRLGETLCTTYHKLYKIPIKIVRPFNIYGPGMRINDYRVISTLLIRGIHSNPFLIYNQGNQTRTFCYIADAAQGFLKALLQGKSGEIYNVGSDNKEISIANLAHLIGDLFPEPITIQHTDYPESYPAGEPQRRCPDLTKIKNELGFIPTVELASGLKKTLVWYQDQLKNETA